MRVRCNRAQSIFASLVQREVSAKPTEGLLHSRNNPSGAHAPAPLTQGSRTARQPRQTDRRGRRSLQDKNLRAPCKTKLPPFSKSFERGMGETFLQESFPHRIPLQLKPSSPSLRRGECPRGHCSQRRRSARRAHGAASYRAKSCARAAPCRTHRAAPTDRTRANPESC